MPTALQRAQNTERNRRWREANRARKREQANRYTARKRAERLAAKALEPAPTTKRCPSCETSKPFAAFGRDRRRANGLYPYCRLCVASKAAAWNAANLATKRASQRKYYAAHRDEIAVKNEALRLRKRAENPAKVLADHRRRQREWRRRNPALAIQRDRKSRARNIKTARACVTKWRANNPDKVRVLRRRHSPIRRARKLGAFVEVVDGSVVYERDGGICGICRLPVKDGDPWHIDHVIPLARGGEHSYRNVQLAHARCNIVKGARLSAA